METIGVDQLLSNSAMYEYICMENINKLYRSDIKFHNEYQYKYIIESAMVCTTEGITENIPLDVVTSGTMKNPSTRKPLSQLLALLYAKQKMMSADWDQPEQSARKSRQSSLYGMLFISL